MGGGGSYRKGMGDSLFTSEYNSVRNNQMFSYTGKTRGNVRAHSLHTCVVRVQERD